VDRLREQFCRQTENLRSALRETYQALWTFQNARTAGNHRRFLLLLDEVAPLLTFFRQYVPADKQGYFLALSDPTRPLSGRVLAFEAAIGALHADFTVQRAHLHKDSRKLREALEACRPYAHDTGPRPPRQAAGALLHGLPASPGVGVGPAFVPRGKADYPRAPIGSVRVTGSSGHDLLRRLRWAVGVVTDEGGPMCPAAIAARELGLPCVVGTKQATWSFKPGWQLQVDGSTGAVSRVAG